MKSSKKRFMAMLLILVIISTFLVSCDGNTNKEKEKINMISDFSAYDYYQGGYTYNSTVSVDEFGRVMGPTLSYRDGEHEVGMFYFLCLGNHDPGAVYDTSKILAMENGLEILTQQDNKISKANQQHFWGEPLYGYYSSSDKWVIRRHMELFTLAGIDFLVFDVSNAVTYDRSFLNVMEVLSELIQEGWDAPQVAFYTNSDSERVIKDLYLRVYKVEKYKETWYYMDGKPLIIGNYYKNDELSEYFTIRESQWPNEAFKDNGFPWMEWTYPAPVHNGVINVCVAAHPALPMSYSLTHGNKNWGRGWDVEKQENIAEDVNKGTFYQSTWDVALKEDPRMIFITGWNEWTASKFWNDGYGEYIFVDTFNLEFSRDAELMRGGYNDAFFIQTAINARKYKSNLIANNTQFPVNHIDINNMSWDYVNAVFRDVGTINEARDHTGVTVNISYQEAAARNNVVEIKVATDSENIYFRLLSTDNITAYEAGDNKWMNLFIGTGNPSLKGWNGYEYVINRNIISDGVGSIEKLSADFSGEKSDVNATYVVDGNVMIITVPRSAIGLSANNNIFYFKFADNITQPSDIMDYYISGKSLPVGRLSFQYLGE